MKRLREPRALAFGRSVDCSLRRIAQSGRAWRSLSTTRTIAQILREAYSAEATHGWLMAPQSPARVRPPDRPARPRRLRSGSRGRRSVRRRRLHLSGPLSFGAWIGAPAIRLRPQPSLLLNPNPQRRRKRPNRPHEISPGHRQPAQRLDADDAVATHFLHLAVGVGDQPVAREQPGRHLTFVLNGDRIGEDEALVAGIRLFLDVGCLDVDADSRPLRPRCR